MSILTSLAGLVARPALTAAAPYLIGAAVLAGGVFIAYEVHHQREIGRNEIRAEDAIKAKAQAEADAEQGRLNAKETFRRLEHQQENQRAQDQELARARAAAARATAAAGRLSVRVDALVAAARRAASDPATVGQRPPDDVGDPIGVLADVLRRADEAAGVMGAFAWESRLRGLKCERDYDALTVKP